MAKKWLFIIFCVAFLLRVIGINSNSLYGDELTIGYDAKYILTTGHDSTGRLLPVTFKLSDGRPAGYVYASIPFIALFGQGIYGIRALSVLSGLGIVILMYYLGKKLYSDNTGLFASAISVVSIWGISMSRAGFESNFALFLSLFGIVFFVYSKEKKWFLPLWALAWGFAIHTYPTYKVSLALFFFVLIWFGGGFKNVAKKQFYLGILILSVFSLIVLKETFFGISATRFLTLNVFKQDTIREELVQKVNFERTIAGLPNNISPIFHNKPVEYFTLLKNSYFNNFSLNYLILSGDKNPRHNPSEMGGIYTIEIIFIAIGLVKLWRAKKKLLVFLLIWLAIGPIATTLLLEQHFLRSSFMLPPFILLSAVGIEHLVESKFRRKYLVLCVLFIAWLIQFVFFVERVYFLAPKKFSSFWSYPAMKASEITKDNINNFDYVILSDQIDNIEFAYPVYSNIDPIFLNNERLKKSGFSDYNFKKIGKVNIGNLPGENTLEVFNALNAKVLIIASYEEKEFLGEYEIINSPDLTHSLVLKKIE